MSAGMSAAFSIKETGFSASAVKLRAVTDDDVLCKISNNRYSIREIKPGTYKFYVTAWSSAKMPKLALELPVEAGKTYYLRMVTQKHYWGGDQYFFQEITYNSAKPLLEKCEEEKECGIN